eukprot:14840849-Alexandrium_andersonii.AAC.1
MCIRDRSRELLEAGRFFSKPEGLGFSAAPRGGYLGSPQTTRDGQLLQLVRFEGRRRQLSYRPICPR